MRRRQSICWDCQKAYGGCSWSKRFEPVEGWTAKKSYLSNGKKRKITDTFAISDCPEFVQDPKFLTEIKCVRGFVKISLYKLGIEMSKGKLSQRLLAQLVGISKTTVANIMSGKACYGSTANRIAAALGIELQKLL